MNRKVLQVSLCLFLGATVTACASKASRPSADQAIASIALADAALEDAKIAGAANYAPIKLRTAREKQVAANRAVDEHKYRQAQHLGAEAQADAELARAAAELAKTYQKLARDKNKVEVLQPAVLVPVNQSMMSEGNP